MIDDGCEYRHPDFIDDQGQTRIAYLYDMLNPAGANHPNNPYGVGTIFTASDINASLKAGGTPIATERLGHGTSTTGIAVGNGSGVADARFAGVAPNARLIVIKAYQRGFPPFAGQPGQSAVFSYANILTALRFAADKIEELDLPGVAVINAGTLGGPADGTSEVSRAMDLFVGRGHSLVCGSGDEGGQANHTSGTLSPGQSANIEIFKGSPSESLGMTLWYSEDDRFAVEIFRPDGTRLGPFASPPTANSFDDRFFSDISYYHRGKDQEWYFASSHRRMIHIAFLGASGIYRVRITAGPTSSNEQYHAVLNPSFFWSDNFFLQPVTGYSIHDFASSFNVVCPGDHVVDNDWTDIDGNLREITNEGSPGQIWLGTSSGPTQDERLGVDFSAPGEMLWAPYYPGSYYSNFRFNMVENGNELYGRQNAVSASNPLVAGVISLMLEANPSLAPGQIRGILRTTARPDIFTGPVPNPRWGFGKLDALAAVNKSIELLYVVPAETSKLVDGTTLGGGLDRISASDNQYWHFQPGQNANPRKQKVGLVLQATTGNFEPDQMRFRVEAKMSGGPAGDVIQKIRLLNTLNGHLELVDTRAVQNFDSIAEVEVTGDPKRFVQSGSGEVTAFIEWSSPRFSGSPYSWLLDLDEAVWIIE